MTTSVAELRKQKYKIRVMHRRFYYLDDNTIDGPFAKHELVEVGLSSEFDVAYERGGESIIELTTPDGVNVKGVAQCSLQDQFNRKRGLSIALGRCLAQLNKETT